MSAKKRKKKQKPARPCPKCEGYGCMSCGYTGVAGKGVIVIVGKDKQKGSAE